MWRQRGNRFLCWVLCALFLGPWSSLPLLAGPVSPESLEQLRQNLLEAKALLATWGQSLSAREDELNERQRFLNEIEQRLSEREAALQANEAALNGRELTLAEKEVLLRERERILSESEADYLESERLISDLKASLKTASESLTVAQARAVALEIERDLWRIGGIAGTLAAIAALLYALSK